MRVSTSGHGNHLSEGCQYRDMRLGHRTRFMESGGEDEGWMQVSYEKRCDSTRWSEVGLAW